MRSSTQVLLRFLLVSVICRIANVGARGELTRYGLALAASPNANQLNMKGRAAMPRAKAKGSSKAKPEDVQWGGFIDLKLDENDKALFAKWADEFQWTYLDDALADEMKISFSFDDDTETYLCSLTSVKHAGTGLRCVLTARAGTWERAAMLALYKHYVMLESDWGRFTPSNGGRRAEV